MRVSVTQSGVSELIELPVPNIDDIIVNPATAIMNHRLVLSKRDFTIYFMYISTSQSYSSSINVTETNALCNKALIQVYICLVESECAPA